MAEKQYIKGCRLLSAAPRSKRRQLLGAGASGGMSMAGANASAGDGAYLSKIKDDDAQGHITFENGATIATGQRFYFADIEHFIELDEEGNFHFSGNVYADGDIVSGGWQTPGEDDVPVVGALSDLTDVKLAGLVVGDIIQWNGTDWVNMPMSSLRPDLTGYATEAWVKAQGYLTQHQSLAGYATQEWVEGKGYALASDLGGYLPLIGGTLTGPLTMGGAGVHRIYFKDAEHFIELDEEGNFHFSGNVYADGDIVSGGWQTPGEDDVPIIGALSDLTDVRLSGLTAGDLIQWNGEKFVNVRPSELGISGAVDLSNYVTLDTAQTITGAKTFTNVLRTNSYAYIGATSNYAIMMGGGSGYIWIDCRQGTNVINNIVLYPHCTTFGKYIKAPSFVKDGGTSSQFLKADGSVDGSSYLTGMPLVAPTANFQDYMAGLKGINWRSGDTTLTYGAMRAADVVLDVGNSYARFFRLMHNRQDGNLRFQGSVVDNPGGWATERTLLDTVNYAGLIDSRYVKKSGDTMTGVLNITKAAADDSAGYALGFSYKNSVGIRPYINIGYGTSGKNNGANIGFCYKGNQSADNYLFLGFSANNELVRLTGNGAVEISHAEYHAINLKRTVAGGGCSIGCTNGDGVYVGDFGFDGTKFFNIRNASNVSLLCALQNGNVGIGTTAPTNPLHVNGVIRSNGLCFLGSAVDNYGIEGHPTADYGTLGDVTGDYAMYFNFGYGAKRGWIWRRKEASSSTLVMSLSCDGKLYVAGTIYATGEITAANGSSDRRLKHRFAVEDYTERILRLGAVMSYEWNETARALDPDKYDTVRHTSVVWQRAHKVGIPGFCGVDDRGYGFVNWLNKDYQAVLLGAVQQTIKTVLRHDDEIKRLRSRVSELEEWVNNKCA